MTRGEGRPKRTTAELLTENGKRRIAAERARRKAADELPSLLWRACAVEGMDVKTAAELAQISRENASRALSAEVRRQMGGMDCDE